MNIIKNLFIIPLVLLLGIINPLYADNLCDQQCQLNLTFPDGGEIVAEEALTITFGAGGFINDGSVNIGYALNETVVLAAGESLNFIDGGEFDLGDTGNIDYTNLSITSNGTGELSAVGGNENVFIYTLSLSGTMTFILNSNVELIGVLNSGSTNSTIFGNVLLNNGTYNVNGGTVGCSNSQSSTTSSNVTLSAGSSNTTSLPPTIPANCIHSIGGNINLSAGSLNLFNPQLMLTPVTPVTVGSLVLNSAGLIGLDSLTLLDNMTLPIADGGSCTVSSNQCITSAGEVYELKDGNLVSIEEGKSGFDLQLILLMSALSMISFINRKSLRIN